MAQENLNRDQNHVTVLGGITDDSNQFTTMLRVDPVTKRLKVTATGAGTGDVVGPASAVDGHLAVFDGTTGKLIKDGGTPGGLTVGTTSISGGTTTRILYDNAGVLGEYTLTGSGTVVAMQTSPSLTTPVITSATVTTKISPTSDDGAPLGDTTHNFSDLFLATGAVINYANSNVVITHTSGILTMGTGDFRVTTAGTNTASVVTVGGTQTLTSKTITSPTITAPAITGATTIGTGATITTPTITKPVLNATNPTAQTYSPSPAATATLDLSLSNQHYITMPAGNITIALSNDTNNQVFLVSITQDATGSRTVTWFTTIRWAGGVAPTLTTTANKRDTFGFIRTGSGTYDAFVIGQNI